MTLPFADGETDPIAIACRRCAILGDDLPALVRAFAEQNRVTEIQETISAALRAQSRARLLRDRYLAEAVASGVTRLETRNGALWIETIPPSPEPASAFATELRIEEPIHVLHVALSADAPAEIRRFAR